MKKSTRNLLALTLAGSMLLPLTACKKNKTTKKNEGKTERTEKRNTEESDDQEDVTEGSDSSKDAPKTLTKNTSRIIVDDDPFYNAESTELKLEPIPGVQFATTKFTTSSILGDRILVNVDVTLKDDSMAEKLLENDYHTFDGNLYSSLQLFDLTGKNLATIHLDESCDFACAAEMSNGEILVIANKVNYGDCKSTPTFFVLSDSGEILRELKYEVEGNLYGMHAYPLENGNLFIAAEGRLFLFDSEGKLIKKTEEASLGPFMNHSEGKWYVAHLQLPSTDIVGYQEVDITTGELKESYQTNKNYHLDLADNTDCFIFSETGIQQYLIAQDKTVPVLSTTNTNLNCANLTNAKKLSDGSMLVLYAEPDKDNGNFDTNCYCYYANTMSVVKLTRADKNPHAGKEVLKISAYNNSDPYFNDLVYQYNSDPNSHAYIEFTTITETEPFYRLRDNEERTQNLSHASKAMIEDMYQGTGPDLVVGFSELSEFNTEEFLTDLKPYLEADTTIKKEDYFDNLFSAFEKNGKLYSFPLTYTLCGLQANGRISDVSEKLTIDELNKLYDSTHPWTRLMPDYANTEVLSLFLTSNYSDFVNNETGEVHFDSDDFKNLLELTKKCGVPEPEYNDGLVIIDDQWYFPEEQFSSGMTFMFETPISSLEEYCILKDTAKLTSFPSAKGKSLTALGQLTLSITKCASNPDLAWEFIRYCLNAEAQEYLSSGKGTMPVNRSAFDKVCQLQIDQNTELYQEYNKNPKEYADAPLRIDDAQKDDFTKLITSIDNSYSLDNEILTVILHEADKYFHDQDTLDNVCKKIQQKASSIMEDRRK